MKTPSKGAVCALILTVDLINLLVKNKHARLIINKSTALVVETWENDQNESAFKQIVEVRNALVSYLALEGISDQEIHSYLAESTVEEILQAGVRVMGFDPQKIYNELTGVEYQSIEEQDFTINVLGIGQA